MIPTTLDEAVDHLLARMTEEDKACFLANSDVAYHHGPGTAMRNGFGLWDESSPLSIWFSDRHLFHADDRSAVIYKALRARLKGETIDIEQEAAHYLRFWQESERAYTTGGTIKLDSGREIKIVKMEGRA
jgi:hypothetical protein